MNIVPLQQKGADQEIVTQFSMNTIEALGLLKMDFLGLRNLDVIDKACALVGNARHRRDPARRQEDVRDAARGEATGVFQFESSGMREALRSGQADGVRGPDRARRALPAGPDGVHPGLREPEERPGAGHATPTSG